MNLTTNLTTNLMENLQPDTALADGEARLKAINPALSVIVQAPAGSGKTALLTQRFLGLLALVEQPESIVAMTFTKKAAAEMRERIIESLELALQPLPANADIYEQNLYFLAQQALANNNKYGWKLLENPSRLRIKTIDSMNAYLVQNLPFLSGMGAQPEQADGVEQIYQLAVRETLQSKEAQDAVGILMPVLNGRFKRAEDLLVNLLAKRDQWMRFLFAGNNFDDQQQLEAGMKFLMQQQLDKLVKDLGDAIYAVNSVVGFAGFIADSKPELVTDLLGADLPLTNNLAQLPAWKQAINLLLTGSGTVRKSVTAREGFPPKTDEKEQMLAILNSLEDQCASKPSVLQALIAIRNLPEPGYSAEQWKILQAVLSLLKLSAAYLKLEFKQQNQVDFIEVSQAASEALFKDGEPTDFALSLDYQLQHLLIDEFQDTSVGQFELIQRLVAGWEPNDGRSLFVVGDPMQSIYGFREAEVANFLQAWQQGIGDIKLTTLNLTVNFRSTAPLVEWFNQTFQRVLPAEDDLSSGAVKYAQAQAIKPATRPGSEQTSVIGHWALNRNRQQEAEQIVDLIKDKLAEFSEQSKPKSLVVLGRSRSHLALLASELTKQEIAFQAVDLEALSERQEVQDALALTRALAHFEDKEAWLALLRAPFIGLNLADLYQLAGSEDSDLFRSLVDLIPQNSSKLSAEGQQRLNQAWLVLEPALNQLGKQPFSRLVHQAWLQLGASSSLPTEVERANIRVFFKGLQQFDNQDLDLTALEEWIAKLFAAGDSSDAAKQVQLMTMHKSKGLQFDTVILPGLDRRTKGNDSELLNWLQMKSDGEQHLLLAPLDVDSKNNGLVKYISDFKKQKTKFELARLLYVATTRAEQELHLFGSLKYTEKQHTEDKPLSFDQSSMLGLMAELVQPEFEQLREAAAQDFAENDSTSQQQQEIKVSRLDNLGFDLQKFAGEQPVNMVKKSQVLAAEASTAEDSADVPRLNLQLDPAPRLVGTLVHEVLDQIAKDGSEHWDLAKIEALKPNYQAWLQAEGLAGESLAHSLQRVLQNLQNALQNPQLRWALSSDLEQSANELALSSNFEETANHIIDRTFVYQGERWILDYKTASLGEQNLAEFLAQQTEIYQPQLDRYGRLFAELEQLPQRKVLYFSDPDYWLEIS